MGLENLLPMLGTLAFGPAGGAVGTAVAGIVGGDKAKGFEDQYNEADKRVNPIDPGQVAMMSALKRQEGAYRAGTDASSSFGMAGVRDGAAQLPRNILRAGGGVGDILRGARVSDRGYAEIASRAPGIANQLLGMRGGIVHDIANKVFGEQKYHRGMKYSQWQNAQQDANNNLQAATGMLAQGVPDAGFLGGLKMGGTSPTNQMNQVPPMNVGQASFSQPAFENQTRGTGGTAPYGTNDPYGVPREALVQNLYGAPSPVARPAMPAPYGIPGANPNAPYTPWASY
jgi:hypothetical protein